MGGLRLATRDWNERYLQGDTPWDTGEPDVHLVAAVEARGLSGGRALEIGSGTGVNAIWLARRGFEVLAVDLAPRAIEVARERAVGAVEFAVADFLADELPSAPYDLVFDRGCFHTFDDGETRRRFAERVAAVLAPGGLWLSLLGSTEGPERDHGPPRRSVRDIADAVEPHLALLELRAVEFDAELPSVAAAWLCVAGRRDVPAQPSTVRPE